MMTEIRPVVTFGNDWEGHEGTFRRIGNDLYLNCSGGDTGANICKSPSVFILSICASYSVNQICQFKREKQSNPSGSKLLQIRFY